jgi:hypothetical protein
LGVQKYLLFDPLLEEVLRRADIVFKCHSLHPQVVPWIYLDIGAVRKGKCWYIVSWITSWAKEHPWSPERLTALMRHTQWPSVSWIVLQLTWALYEHLIHFN